MPLCIVNPFEHGGGAEYQLSLFIDALVADDRYDVYYLAHFVDGRSRARRYRIVQIGDAGPIPRLGYIMDAPSLYGKLRAIGPCAIYQRVACGYTGICASYARRHAIPMLWHVAHDTDVSPRILDPARNVIRVQLEKRLVGYGARRAAAVIVQTQHQADLLQRNFKRTAAAVVPNFHPPAAEVIDKSGPLTVVWIANLKTWKRPEAFVRLARHLNGSPDVRFVMVGEPATAGNAQWHDALMRDIEATPNLEYLGHKSHTEVNELLARSHIYVNTSVHEGFPNTFIQSWMRDVAVVSLSVDPDEVLERREVGIFARSEEGLVAGVRSLLASPELRSAYASRGRGHAKAHHSLRNAQDLIGLVDRCRGASR
jgi:glycosyltransferase involved in cell wall biosynthesis